MLRFTQTRDGAAAKESASSAGAQTFYPLSALFFLFVATACTVPSDRELLTRADLSLLRSKERNGLSDRFRQRASLRQYRPVVDVFQKKFGVTSRGVNW